MRRIYWGDYIIQSFNPTILNFILQIFIKKLLVYQKEPKINMSLILTLHSSLYLSLNKFDYNFTSIT